MVDLERCPKTAGAFGINIKSILAAMRAERVRRQVYQVTAVCHYSGPGGHGRVDRVDVLAAPSREEGLTLHVQIPRFTCQKVVVRGSPGRDRWDEDGPVTEEMDFAEALENLTYEGIDITGHRGYESGVGAEGSFTLHVVEGDHRRVRLVHQDQMTVGEDLEYEFEIP